MMKGRLNGSGELSILRAPNKWVPQACPFGFNIERDCDWTCPLMDADTWPVLKLRCSPTVMDVEMVLDVASGEETDCPGGDGGTA